VSSPPVDEKREKRPFVSADLVQLLFAGAALILLVVGSVHAEFMYIESKFDRKLDASMKELKDEREREHERDKDERKRDKDEREREHERAKDEHDREHKRFKDALRLQAQATMNPSRAHFMFADQRSVDDVLSDKEYKSEARVRDRSWWQWLRES
jgi:superfamily II DNA/RNA helicase